VASGREKTRCGVVCGFGVAAKALQGVVKISVMHKASLQTHAGSKQSDAYRQYGQLRAADTPPNSATHDQRILEGFVASVRHSTLPKFPSSNTDADTILGS
jgi:hypothetical protein